MSPIISKNPGRLKLVPENPSSFVHLMAENPVIITVFRDNFDLMLNTVAVPLVLVIAGEADIEGRPFFALVVVLPIHHSLQSGSHRFFPCDIYII